MQPPKTLLELPVSTAARWVALDHLRDSVDAADRVLERGDADALHDLRVSLRRLHRALKDFRPALADTVRGRHRRRVRSILAAGGPARDADVLIGWAERLLAEDPPAAADPDRLLADLRERRSAEMERLVRRLGSFPRLARRLRKRLSRYEVRVGKEAPELPVPAAEAVGAALALALVRARARFAAIGEGVEEEALHEGRIALRRLRYLLEPFAAALPDGEQILADLRALQGVLGDLRDLAALLRETDALAAGDTLEGALLLAHRARARRDEARSQLTGRWRAGEAERLLGRVEALAAGLGGAGEDVEIERKYLLSALPELPPGAETLEVRQGWFGERIAERVRRVRDGDGERAFRTIKHGRGVKRLELEEPISPELLAVLWPLTEGRRVSKRRWRVPEGELCWEIDEFTDRELVLAEVEIPTADHPVVFPPWLEPLVVREVTHEAAYVNLNLAR